MTKVAAGITISLDGYVAGPNDRPGQGLGEDGERLHYWVFGGPWSDAEGPQGGPTGEDKRFFDETMGGIAAVIGGRTTFDLAFEEWGRTNPFGAPFFIVTHRPDDEPPRAGFSFVNGLDAAIERAREAAGGKDVWIMGGADVIRQALRAGHVDELSISVAPVVLAEGKPLFDGSQGPLELEPIRVLQSPFATHITYRVPRG